MMGINRSSIGTAFSNRHPSDCLDLLLVVDEYDCVKRCTNGIESVLKTTKFNNIKRCSIFDFENEKQTIKCKKVVFIVLGAGSKHHIEKWIEYLPNIRGDSLKCLVICLRDHGSTLECDWGQMPNIDTYGIEEALSWFPKVLYFIYGTNAEKRTESFCLIESDSASLRYAAFQNQFKTTLHQLAITSIDLNEKPHTIAIVCNSLDDKIHNEVKTKMRNEKVNGGHIYVLANSYSDIISDDVKWVATRVYTKNEIMLFILHLLTRLGLLQSNEDFVKAPEKPKARIRDINITDPVYESERVLITWKHKSTVETTAVGSDGVNIQHRTSVDKRWTPLVEHLSRDTMFYEASGLDTSCQHQFRLIVETNDGESDPVYSSWFSWKVYHKGKLVLKTFLIILSVLIGLFTIPQLLLKWPLLLLSKNGDAFMKYSGFYWFICFAGSITFFAFYGIFDNWRDEECYRYSFHSIECYGSKTDHGFDKIEEQYMVWLLICGLYLLTWCFLADLFIYICVQDELSDLYSIGNLQLPKTLYRNANKIKAHYIIGEIDNMA